MSSIIGPRLLLRVCYSGSPSSLPLPARTERQRSRLTSLSLSLSSTYVYLSHSLARYFLAQDCFASFLAQRCIKFGISSSIFVEILSSRTTEQSSHRQRATRKDVQSSPPRIPRIPRADDLIADKSLFILEDRRLTRDTRLLRRRKVNSRGR